MHIPPWVILTHRGCRLGLGGPVGARDRRLRGQGRLDVWSRLRHGRVSACAGLPAQGAPTLRAAAALGAAEAGNTSARAIERSAELRKRRNRRHRRKPCAPRHGRAGRQPAAAFRLADFRFLAVIIDNFKDGMHATQEWLRDSDDVQASKSRSGQSCAGIATSAHTAGVLAQARSAPCCGWTTSTRARPGC